MSLTIMFKSGKNERLYGFNGHHFNGRLRIIERYKIDNVLTFLNICCGNRGFQKPYLRIQIDASIMDSLTHHSIINFEVSHGNVR
jgi:hypothetical protein